MKVLVTNCTRHTGLATMRALARAGCEVFGADDRRFPLGLRSRFAAGRYEWLPPESDPALASALTNLIERLQPEVLIPFRGSACAIRQRATILRLTNALLPEPTAWARLHDKSALMELCAELDVLAPSRFDIQEAEDRLRRDRTSPIVVRPCRDVGGGRGVSFVSDPDCVAGTAAQVTAAYGKALLTEYVPGPTDNLRAVHLLFDDRSRLIGHFVLKKYRLWPRSVGVTVAGVSTHEPWLVRQILPIFQALRWCGPADAEFKIDARDGCAKLLEINPRFSGIVHFSIACGVNFPLLYARAARGERLPETLEPHYAAGVRYLTRPRWFRSLASELRAAPEGRLVTIAKAFASEWRGHRVPSIHELSDPAPTLGRVLLAVRAGGRRAHR